MSWLVKQADNGGKSYRIERHTGEVVKVAVPVEHQADVTSKAYVKAVQDGHELSLAAPIKFKIVKSAVTVAAIVCSLLVPKVLVILSSCIILSEIITLYKLIKARG